MEETNKLFYGSIPQVLNEDILSFLCLKHKDEISIGSYKNFPRPRIRYVIDKNRFGIDTGYDDSNGRRMFTGDIVLVKEPNGYEMGTLCLASSGGIISDGFYGFPLDNHSLTLDMCIEDGYNLERIGTIFYQLDPCEEPVSIWEQALTFNNTYRDKEEESVLRTMARYTPNFDKEVWKYLGLEILGIEEFNWKK